MRLVIVGAGPGGVRAAEAAVQTGLRPVLIDEGTCAGGQIYRRQPEGFTRPAAKLYGSEASKAQALHARFDALRMAIDYRPNSLAWHLTSDALHVVQDDEAHALPYDALLICSGATDRLLPVPGWQRAGCYSLGAAQIALKAQACAIGRRVAFLGSGPLLYLVASQYVNAGVDVAAVLDTAPARKSWAALRGLMARPALAWRGLSLIHELRAADVPLLQGVRPVHVEGDEIHGATAVVVQVRGREVRFDADAVALGWHLRAESQLADLAGCAFDFEPLSGQWLPRVDADGRTTVQRVYLAGDGARILGADGAEAAGRLAALAALSDAGHAAGHALYQAERDRLQARLARMDRFRRGLAHAFPWPREHATALPDETVLCRCEAITVGELRRCTRELGSHELNRAKSFSRVGMGRCQGRYCSHAAAEVIAACAGIPVEQVGRLRTQAPVKPLLMSTRERVP